jgi:hypothetical protein
LDGFTVERGEGGTQDFVATDDVLQALLESGGVERAEEAHPTSDIISGRGGF